MKIGFSGLGKMGKPMALHLSKCGKELIVNDVVDTHFAEFEKNGVRTTKNIKDFADCNIIFLCLPNVEVVYDTLFGKGDLASSLKPGQIICDFSTSNYNKEMEICDRLNTLGIRFMDAPISGMESKAIEGTLTIMCGGEKALYDELLPYCKYMGDNIIYMGANGCGQLTKTINNTLYDIHIAAFSELIPFAVKMGLEPERIINVINSSTGRSYASQFFLPRILDGIFEGTYTLNAAYKDLVSCAELAARKGVPLPVTHSATNTYQRAILEGLGDNDKGAMVKVFEKLLDVEVRK